MYVESEVWYGKVYEGKTQAASEAVPSSGWSSYQMANGWIDQYTYSAGETLTFTIPVTHNRIHVWLVHGCGIVSFTLDGGTTGLDVNTIDTSDYITNGVIQEHIVATSAAGTTFVITTVDASISHAVIGITTYDDDKLGNPATASGGIATGHNLIT
jgi:hypothetical protein